MDQKNLEETVNTPDFAPSDPRKSPSKAEGIQEIPGDGQEDQDQQDKLKEIERKTDGEVQGS